MPLLPEYLEEITDDEVIFRNYEGKRFVYKQPKPAAAPTPAEIAAQKDVVPIRRKKKAKVGKVAAARTRRRASGE